MHSVQGGRASICFAVDSPIKWGHVADTWPARGLCVAGTRCQAADTELTSDSSHHDVI